MVINRIQPNEARNQDPVIRRQSLPSKKHTVLISLVSIMMLWIVISLLSNVFAWKAVFLDSNQVFFGKFVRLPFSSTITLRKAHYIKPAGEQSASSTTANQDLIIAPIGDMTHSPEDSMVITRDHILYSESLRPGSTIVKGLQQSLSR